MTPILTLGNVKSLRKSTRAEPGAAVPFTLREVSL